MWAAIKTFTWPGSNSLLGDHLAAVAVEADRAGLARLSVMDRLWQISTTGLAKSEMLEAYTTLALCDEEYLADPRLLATVVTSWMHCPRAARGLESERHGTRRRAGGSASRSRGRGSVSNASKRPFKCARRCGGG